MTPQRRGRGQPPKLKLCAYCKVAIASTRFPVLVTTWDNRIIGPFHAGCAERLVIRGKQGDPIIDVPGATNYGTRLTAREETLPW